MTRLIVRDDDRDATCVDIYRCTTSWCGHEFPVPHSVCSDSDAIVFARWCLTPLSQPTALLIVLDGCGEVQQYLRVSVGDQALLRRNPWEVIDNLADFRGYCQTMQHLLFILGLPEDSAIASQVVDSFAEECCVRMDEEGYARPRYLRAVISQHLPQALHIQQTYASTPLSIDASDEGLVDRAMRVEEVAKLAMALNARRLQWRQPLCCPLHATGRVQMQVGSIPESAWGVLILDSDYHVLRYRHLCYGDVAQAIGCRQLIVDHAKAACAIDIVLVYAVPCLQSQLKMPSQPVLELNQYLRSNTVHLRACWTVCLDGVQEMNLADEWDSPFARFQCSMQPFTEMLPAALDDPVSS